MIPFIVSFIFGYLVGSIPTAWLYMRFTTGADIRSLGTGNVGARNVWEQTIGHRGGLIVLFADLLKGGLGVTAISVIYTESFLPTAIAGTALLIGHNFNIFLKGRGGRGLAPATGIFIFLNPLVLVHWFVMYFVGFYGVRRQVHIASTVATLGAAVLVLSTPWELFELTMTGSVSTTPPEFKIFTVACSIVIFLRHINPVREALYGGSPSGNDI